MVVFAPPSRLSNRGGIRLQVCREGRLLLQLAGAARAQSHLDSRFI